jgi:FkbM family methyltransferase
MEVSLRAFVHRILTYPILSIIMIVYALAENKRKILDAFYFIRGFPHGFMKNGDRIAFYDGLVMIFPFIEDPSFDDVWLRDVYYPYKPRSDDVVIDVGAHMGFFTLKIARKVEKVVAVEPDPANFLFLTLNVQINRLKKKVAVHNFALGEDNCQMFLDKSGYGGGRSRTTLEKTDYRVETRTLDEFVEKIGLDHVDLIKIDTEGNELCVLRGACEVLRKYEPDLLVAAYHFPDEPSLVAGYLKRCGYNVSCYDVPLILSCNKETYLYAIADDGARAPNRRQDFSIFHQPKTQLNMDRMVNID